MATDISDTPDTHTVDFDGLVSQEGIAHVVQDVLWFAAQNGGIDPAGIPLWEYADDEERALAMRVAAVILEDIIARVWGGAYICGQEDGMLTTESRSVERPNPYIPTGGHQ